MRQPGSAHSEGRQSLFEVLVFLFLIMPSMALSFLVVKQGNVSFIVTAISSILRDLSLVCLILYFIWCNGEKIAEIGWKLSGAAVEVLIGAILFVPVFFLTALLERTLQNIGFSVPATPLPSALTASGPSEFLLGDETLAGCGPDFFDYLFPRPRLRRSGRGYHHWCVGVGLCRCLQVAGQPDRAHDNAFSPGFSGDRSPTPAQAGWGLNPRSGSTRQVTV
jgi:hypothetical protein